MTTIERQMHVLKTLYVYDDGQSRVDWIRGGLRDWYVWSVSRQTRLATYHTRRELLADYDSSDNSDGAFGCALRTT